MQQPIRVFLYREVSRSIVGDEFKLASSSLALSCARSGQLKSSFPGSWIFHGRISF